MVLHLLKQPKETSQSLVKALDEFREKIVFCKKCHNLSDNNICEICLNSKRDASQICVVEDIRDVMAIENTNQFKGLYHVLNGIISPIDGIGPQNLTISSLIDKVKEGPVNEVIFALSATMEGDTTIFYIHRQLSSFNNEQPLAMVPFWNGKMALIDGSRLFLFDLDMDHSYWLNPHSRPSGFPLSTGVHDPADRGIMRRKAYNYPNPITEGTTTFRFYVSNSTTSEVRVKIYNAAGFLVEDNLTNNDLTHYEFNEIIWDASQFDAGFYMAEIKPNVGQSELVRLVVVK